MPVSCITPADFSCEFHFVDVEAKSGEGAPNVGKYDESFKSTPGLTDIRTHFTDVNWRENKRGGKRAPGNAVAKRMVEKTRHLSLQNVTANVCERERKREEKGICNCHKRKYIIF